MDPDSRTQVQNPLCSIAVRNPIQSPCFCENSRHPPCNHQATHRRHVLLDLYQGLYARLGENPRTCVESPTPSSTHGGRSFTRTHKIAKGSMLRMIAVSNPSRVAKPIL